MYKLSRIWTFKGVLWLLPRCDDDHQSSIYSIPREEPIHYALYHDHSASYMGCLVYKDLQHCKKPNLNT